MKIPPRIKKHFTTARGVYFSMLEAWAQFAAFIILIMYIGVAKLINHESFSQQSPTIRIIYLVVWLFCFSMPPLLLIAAGLLHKLVVVDLVKEIKEGEVEEVVA